MDAGARLLALALLLAAVLYAPTLSRGLVNYDDPWLVRDNALLAHPSWRALATIFGELHGPARHGLGAEYLPIRDLSVMLDLAVWGDSWWGHHATNLAIYLGAIALAWAFFVGWGIDRTVAGIAVLLWAVHPSHAESVAWLSERKGLLGAAFALACGAAFAAWRARPRGGHGWLALAIACAVCAVWSKAPAAFAVASLAALEVLLPAKRVSWRRSLVGLGAIAVAGAVAYAPVVLVAMGGAVVGSSASGISHAGRAATVIGVHGFYIELLALARANAVSYPILSHGPSALELVLGAISLGAACTAVAWRRVPAPVRAGAAIWLATWLPIGHLILPLQQVLVADRYLLLPSLGAMLALASLIPKRRVLVGAIVLAASLRTFDAQGSWSSPRELWARATLSNPDDTGAWSMYAEALDTAGRPDLADAAVARGLEVREDPRLLLRQAILAREHGDPATVTALFRRAAEAGEPRAMSDLALLELPANPDEALAWARRGAALEPALAHSQRTLGKCALAAHPDEALAAFSLALALEPTNAANEYNVALALLALHRAGDAVPHLESIVTDPTLGARARDALDEARRQLRR